MQDDVYIGALSGTSMDAVDVAAVRFSRADSDAATRVAARIKGRVELLACANATIPEELRERIRKLQHENISTVRQATAEHEALGRLFARAISHLIEKDLGGATVAGIGLHGQTVLHRPDADPPFTLQIGDPRIVAAQTGCVTVADFRQSDLAVGGQGAPFAPAFHHAFFACAGETLALVNIGGISNITWLESDGGYAGYDCGPGNILLDAWIHHHRDEPFDRDGAWAQSGVCDEQLLARLLDEKFFRLPPPKSACATDFDLAWLTQKITGDIAPEDVQASLVELTARCIAAAVNDHTPAPARVLICGGGAHNGYLMTRLQAMIEPPVTDTGADTGADTGTALSPDWIEAAGFAYLARQRLENRTTDLRAVTGAREAVVLGEIYAP